ncbi:MULTISPECIES: LIC11213 family lipoprotein [Leptospira]|uniref:Planctomycete cytochrome C n=6 Tax=Leptospira santarosai TaxID=28183 RepID=A0AB73N163_9LEPT|nr:MULTISPECIES: c-type cytochrome domain-containing protein [Leptospira]EMO55960.1 planctomycete cytochrome C [Leptospira santarosai str. CBC1416]AVV49556.1 Planctomycete cytochrome C [Leptospira santarosai]AVV80054.1 Planctomycete cytochrome C [Leptospira santarosai]EKO35517.1 planctomycete cytochrome C [Leptospira santarosai str. MOR084]EKO76488.1 planctomycete cytochrome C [Leptospira sp. Fiocruz LV3954]
MKKIHNSFLLVLCLSLGNCQNEKSSDKEDSLRFLAFLLNSTTPLKELTNADCADPAPAFSTLNQAGTGSCSTCHNASNSNAGFDVTSYNSVRNRVTVNDPKNSLLFQKINTGSMRVNNNESINKAVFCWILKGANP